MNKTIKVQKGEGPWQVARRAGISLDELYRLNPKAKKMIHPDQELVINDGTTTTATVKKGEGPWQVAQRMGVSLEDVYKYNPKARKMIYPGDKLTIPIKQGTKKDTESNQETKSSDTNNTSTSNKVANDSIKNNANKTTKTTGSPVKGNAQSAPKDTTKTQVAPKDTVGTNKPSNKSNNNTKVNKRLQKDTIYNGGTLPEAVVVGKKPKKDTIYNGGTLPEAVVVGKKPKKDTIYNGGTLPEAVVVGKKPKKDLETTVRQWQARKNNPSRSYRNPYDSYAPAVGPRKVSQTRRLDAIHDIGTAIDVDPRLLIGKGTSYTTPPVVSKKNPSKEENSMNRLFLSPANNLIKRLPSFTNPIGPLLGLGGVGMVGVSAPIWAIAKGIDGLGYNLGEFAPPSWNTFVRDASGEYLMDLEDTFNEGFGLPTRKRNGGSLYRRRLESAGVLSI